MRLQGRREHDRSGTTTTRDTEFLLVDAHTLRVRGSLSLDDAATRRPPHAPAREDGPGATVGHLLRAHDSRVPRRHSANPGALRVRPTLSPLPELTSREQEVLEALGEGKSTSEIAAALHLSVGTVKGYLSSIMAKWNARDRVQVIVLAVRSGALVLT